MLNSSDGSQCMTRKVKLQTERTVYRALLETSVPLAVSLHYPVPDLQGREALL